MCFSLVKISFCSVYFLNTQIVCHLHRDFPSAGECLVFPVFVIVIHSIVILSDGL